MDSETLEEASTPHAGDGGSGGEGTVTPVEEASVEGKVEGEEKKKRGRKRKTAVEEGAEKKQTQRKRRSATGEPATPVERPSRERKAVDRFIQMSPRKVSASKVLTIEQGPGTKLKDIPNVNFKLSKRKADENLQVLHTILFGRKSNAHFLKRNIFQFSGFVWSENEEKHRSRIKEKIDKCTKDRLLDFSELLDIQILRATSKKEEISEKLLDFLQSPHATRDALLADKEKKGKRKRRTKGISQATTEAPLAKSTEKHKSTPETESKRGRKQSSKTKKEEDESGLAEKEDEDAHASAESEDLDEGDSTDKEDKDDIENIHGDSEENDQVISEEEDEEDEIEESTPSRKQPDKKQKASVEKSRQKTAPLQKGTTTKSGKSPKNSVSKKTSSTLQPEPNAQLESKKDPAKGPSSSKVISKEKASPVRSSRKTSKITGESSSRKSNADISASSPPSSKSKKENKRDHNNENQPIKEKSSGNKQGAKRPIKGQVKRKSAGDAKVEPSTEELRSVVSDLLKEVDFNTATLADILKQLGAHFNADLMDRKVEVKRLIEDVIKNMTDDEEDAEDAEEVDEKEESDDESD